jgi:putative pre-16S rRNA nuclease
MHITSVGLAATSVWAQESAEEAHIGSRYTDQMGSARNVPYSKADEASRAAILAVDYGRARIGLALADSETRMPQPLSTMERVNRNEDMRRLREVVREHGVKQIVVGLPLRLDGTRGEMAEEVERFAQRVRKQVGVPVEMVDERLTSWEAERLMEEIQGRFIRDEKLGSNKKPKNVQAKMTVDAVAAAVILKEYLDRSEKTAEKA